MTSSVKTNYGSSVEQQQHEYEMIRNGLYVRLKYSHNDVAQNEPPYTLLTFPSMTLLVIDESHVTARK